MIFPILGEKYYKKWEFGKINTLNSKDKKKSKTKVKICGKSCYTMLGASLVGSTSKCYMYYWDVEDIKTLFG